MNDCRHRDSLYGRCADCGMTWDQQAAQRAQQPVATYGINRDAHNPKTGMTLDELGAFVQACHRLGQDGSTPIRAVLGWGGQIRSEHG